ncbi:acylphosphatase [Gracilibacillus sp. D59]|uniref:acylphosphatase n=1 Tax=Gracilibacillus sp. D59 TaxID=3457434 RepID=UPI003FCE16E1
MRQVHVIVSGRVQGVGFRAFAQQVALENDIAGWVKNLGDGSVEIEAQGEDHKVERFLKQVKKGPSFFAKVKNIEITEKDIENVLKKFEIHY